MTKHLAKLMMIPEFIIASLFEKHVCTTYDYIMARLGYELSYFGQRFACSWGEGYICILCFSPPDMTGYY